MKKLLTFAAAAVMATAASATIYNDATVDTLATDPIMDIVSVEVLNDATDLILTLTLSGDVDVTDWGKYLVGIDSAAGGDTASNGWGRPIAMSSGMDYWIGSWVDAGNGGELYSWDGSAWNAGAAPSISKSGNDVTLTAPLASLGLSVNDSFTFDVFTSGGGGGDGAVDALSDPNQTIADWADSYDSTSTLSYTVIPEPGTLSLLLVGIGSLLYRRLRRR